MIWYHASDNPFLTLTCTNEDCSNCEGPKECTWYTVTVSSEKTEITIPNLQSISNCGSYGDTVYVICFCIACLCILLFSVLIPAVLQPVLEDTYLTNSVTITSNRATGCADLFSIFSWVADFRIVRTNTMSTYIVVVGT